MVAGFAWAMATLFRRASGPLLARSTRLLGSPIPVVVGLTLLASAFTEALGIHALFGAFLAGSALSDSGGVPASEREPLRRCVLGFFAPIFMAGIGLRVDLIASFDPALVAFTLVLACAGKILGCGIAGRLAGLPAREAWAVGFCLNSRGAMEIILGLVALENGLISQELFVALVVMALVTSMMVGPIVSRLVRREETLSEPFGGSGIPPAPELAGA
jgi:Kef-type K+ transport system membrane component KefB